MFKIKNLSRLWMQFTSFVMDKILRRVQETEEELSIKGSETGQIQEKQIWEPAKTFHLGKIQAGTSRKFKYTFEEDKQIETAKASCWCTGVTFEDNVLNGTVKIKAHEANPLFVRNVEITFKDGTKTLLILKADVTRPDTKTRTTKTGSEEQGEGTATAQ